tara:strand:+ start:650 stop:1285 length:636 start_codon:yes stop_codon:yes gene_type:complete
MSRTGNPKLLWHEWNPGLDNDQWTLGYVLDTMPSVEADDIPLIIRIFENPSSFMAFPGAITLARHDAIHALLGRGLRVQDEAFVIGFTMGAASRLKNWHVAIFALIAQHLYRKPYNFKARDIMVFRMGIWEGRMQKCQDLQDFDFENHRDQTLRDLRKKLGIDRNRLYSLYAYEKLLHMDTKASRRLDTDLKQLDVSALEPDKRKERDDKH